MAFLNALGLVSRRGEWRLRRVMRTALPDGRLDSSDEGLIDFASASLIRLTVTPRLPVGPHAWCAGWSEPEPVLVASTDDGTLLVNNPGLLEAVFPHGWGRTVRPGFYDVRIAVTIGNQTIEIFDQPVEIR